MTTLQEAEDILRGRKRALRQEHKTALLEWMASMRTAVKEREECIRDLLAEHTPMGPRRITTPATLADDLRASLLRGRGEHV